MKTHWKTWGAACALAVVSAASSLAHAQLLVGQTVGITGSAAATVKESMLGASLYLDHVNARGGVNGQKIELVVLDDKFDPKLTQDNARTLIEDKGVLALFMTRGTPHTQGIVALLDKYGVPLVGPSTGAMALHQPVSRNIFNVRAPYQREVEKAIAHLALLGVQRIGIVHVDDAFGQDGLAGAQKGLQNNKLPALFVEKFDRAKPDFSAIAPRVRAQDPRPSSSSAPARRSWTASRHCARPAWAGRSSRCQTMRRGASPRRWATRPAASSSRRSFRPSGR